MKNYLFNKQIIKSTIITSNSDLIYLNIYYYYIAYLNIINIADYPVDSPDSNYYYYLFDSISIVFMSASSLSILASSLSSHIMISVVIINSQKNICKLSLSYHFLHHLKLLYSYLILLSINSTQIDSQIISNFIYYSQVLLSPYLLSIKLLTYKSPYRSQQIRSLLVSLSHAIILFLSILISIHPRIVQLLLNSISLHTLFLIYIQLYSPIFLIFISVFEQAINQIFINLSFLVYSIIINNFISLF